MQSGLSTSRFSDSELPAPFQSRNGTYDGQSETAYLVAKLILSYMLAKAPRGSLPKIRGPQSGSTYSVEKREEIKGRGETISFLGGVGGDRGLMCAAYCAIKVRPLQLFMEVPCS